MDLPQPTRRRLERLRSQDPLRGACRVIARLQRAGHTAMLCGGGVRDLLRGVAPKDYDIVTTATPDQIERLFSRTVPIGRAFGVIQVLTGGIAYEVATSRADMAYEDGRRPSGVRFASLAEDAARRDFTINGMFLDPLTARLEDHVGGRADLAAGRLRTIGAPDERFGEDVLRLLRAVRFAAQLGFAIDPAAREAIVRHAPELARVSAERIAAELTRTLTGPRPGEGMRLLDTLGLLPVAAPELAAAPAAERARAARALDRLAPAPLPLALAAAALGRSAAQRRALHVRLRGVPRDVLGEAEALGEDLQTLDALSADAVAGRKRVLRTSRAPALLALLRARQLADGARLSAYHAARFDRWRWRQAGTLAPAVLLDGGALLALGVPRGPRIGALLRGLEDAQLTGQVRDEAAARCWVATQLEATP